MSPKSGLLIGLSFVAVIVLFLLLSMLFHDLFLLPTKRAWRVAELVDGFILANGGRFPTSEEDLENQHFISKNQTRDGTMYYQRSGQFDPKIPYRDEGWRPFRGFGRFKIAYGVDIHKLEMGDGKLYDKTTQEQVLLIEGPQYKSLLKHVYELISAHWYELMEREQQEEN